MSPTPKENILQNQNRNENLKSTSLENPTKLKSSKREKSTKVKVAEKVLGGKKLLQESNISATKPVGGEGGGSLKFEPHPQRDYPSKNPTEYENKTIFTTP